MYAKPVQSDRTWFEPHRCWVLMSDLGWLIFFKSSSDSIEVNSQVYLNALILMLYSFHSNNLFMGTCVTYSSCTLRVWSLSAVFAEEKPVSTERVQNMHEPVVQGVPKYGTGQSTIKAESRDEEEGEDTAEFRAPIELLGEVRHLHTHHCISVHIIRSCWSCVLCVLCICECVLL